MSNNLQFLYITLFKEQIGLQPKWSGLNLYYA